VGCLYRSYPVRAPSRANIEGRGTNSSRRLEHAFRTVERAPNASSESVGENGVVITFEEFDAVTRGRLDALDITSEVQAVVKSSRVERGNVLVFSPHTTCCVILTSPGRHTERALARAMAAIAPESDYYAHDDLAIRTENLVADEPANAPAHIFHVFAGKASECIPIQDGEIALGDGQHVLFVELDSARARRYCIQVVGE
jgi:secondary thiamine-phosphate synthase enzyme